MKIKYYLRGVGIGLILSTIILTISKPKISNKEIIKRAKQLGMVMDDYNNRNDLSSIIKNKNVTDSDNNEKQIDDKENLDSKEKSDNKDIDNKFELDNDLDKDILDKNDENKELEIENDDINTKEDINLVKISIKQGMYSSDVASILFDKNLIDDKFKFDNYMIESKQSEIIDTGDYDIPMGSTFEEIAKIITR